LSDLKGCVPIDTAVYDAAQQIAIVEPSQPARAARYKQAFGDAESQKNLSPVTHVAKGKAIPPFLILHVADRPDSRAQSQILAKVLRDAGVSATVLPGEGKTHGTINSDLGLPDDPPTKAVFEFLAAVTTPADDAKDKAIKKDRQQIAGTWRVVALEVNGNKAAEEDAKKLSVVNGSDGTWSLRSEGNEISQGTSVFDPSKAPKTIDFTPADGAGKGEQYLGIYELGEKRRKLCFAPAGKSRPTAFSSAPGSEHVLVTFERE
jgi:uncharacterized protein (TIGR03067 family)